MKKTTRRQFLKVTGLSAGLLSMGALASCQQAAAPAAQPAAESTAPEAAAPEAPTAEQAAAPSAEPTEISVWWWLSEPWKSATDTYNSSQEDIVVNLSEIGDAVFGDQKYLTAVAAGKGPDASIQNRHTFAQFAAKGLYKALDDYYKADGFKNEDWAPVQLQESMWNGALYGLPLNTDTRHLFYNKTMLDEAGLTKPPETWDEVDAYTEKLTKKNGDEYEVMGFVPYLVGNSWMWMYGFLNKAPSISPDKRTILCDDERWTYALEWMTSIYDKYLGNFEIATSFNDGFASQTQDLFIQKRVAMEVTGDWELNRYSRFPDLDFAMVPMAIPPEGEKSSWSCGWSMVIPPDAQHPEAAWSWLKWITGVDGWRAIAEADKAETLKIWSRDQIQGDPVYVPAEACYLPALEMLRAEYVAKLPEKLRNEFELGIDCLENWTHGCGSEMGLTALEYWVEIDNAARNALSHKMTAAEAMKACKDKVQAATDEAWASIDNA